MEKNPEGIIFNIQKFSLNDGPGIRTVVFFKGCPLRCAWCANPESQSPRPEQVGDKTEGKLMTVPEVMEVVLQDLPFYEESGGGVTLSGGEAMMQPDFAEALLAALQEQGLHTAMETTGFAAPEVFRRLCGRLDLLLFDVKHWDEARHRQGTGVSNQLILENLAWAVKSGPEVLPRLPVIPGFNASLEDAAGFARLLQKAGLSKVQLLPFHQLGEGKYAKLGREYALAHKKALRPEDLEDFRQRFLDRGLEAFF